MLRSINGLIFCGLFYTLCTSVNALELETGGHIKFQSAYTVYPSSSVFRSQLGSSTSEIFNDIRLKFSVNFDANSPWDFNADYQIVNTYSERLNTNPDLPFFGNYSISDDSRLFDLTDTITTEDKWQMQHRLDRLNIGYTSEKSVLRFGRQALSWGNGLLFSVMDIVNPFDPTVFDKEYKAGDDMLYVQYLQDTGNDLQFAWVLRRDLISGDLDSDRHTFAAKYHVLLQSVELDIMLAEHYGESIFALGVNAPLGGAIIYADLTASDIEKNTYISGLLGLSYSWVGWQKNFSGLLEFYHNDFGLDKPGNYSDLATNTLLFERINRGDIFNLGRNYLAASLTSEITPLLLSGLNVFYNMDDSSTLIQLTAQYDWKQNSQLFFAVSLPGGNNGSEYGGPELNGNFLSTNGQIITRFSWYF